MDQKPTKKRIATIKRANTPAAKASTRKTATKKAVKKTVKVVAKKVAVKKVAAKKTPAKKTATKKPALKKTAAKKATAKATPKAAPKSGKAKVAPKPAPSPKSKPAPQDEPVYTDMANFARYMADINIKTQEIMGDVAERQAKASRQGAAPSADPFNVADAGNEVAQALSANPVKLMQMQISLWDDYTKLFTATVEKMSGAESEPIVKPLVNDRRFRHKAWEENPMLDFAKQSYLLLAQWVEKAIVEAEDVAPETKRRAFFHADQFLSAMSPSNVPGLNPVVMDKTIESQGANWLEGMKNFVTDLERGNGELAITQTDLDFFKVGENIATTPGKVIYQNDMLQLIQYEPTTETVADRPMVIFPPWINKFYILDLQKENSFIRWLVDQGRTVFIVSWVNPDSRLREKSFPDYMREGVFEVLEAVERATGMQSFDTIGYCIGGTLLSTTLSYMAQHGDERINSSTFFTAQTDFKLAGDLLLFVDEKQLSNIEKQMESSGGILEGSAMARTFNMLRPNDLIWSAIVDNYYLGKKPKKFDLLFWNADATRMTKACHLYYLREFYHENNLAENRLEIGGTKLDLSKVTIPIFMQAGERDHIAPYQSVYRSAKLFGGDVHYMLAGSGHIAGVINHPDKKKYHYSSNDALPESLDEWIEGAERHEFSWWPYWIKWLDKQSGGSTPARFPGDGDLTPIEDAPGSYVMVRSDP